MLELAAEVRRGDGIDALHTAAIAVVDESSQLIAWLGDPEQTFLTRSAIKPLQALPLVSSGALDALVLNDEALALASGSHDGGDRERDLVLNMLEHAGLGPEALACGSDWPIGMRLRGEYPSAGEDEDPLRHNCSGKHAGFLALSRQLRQTASTYLERDGAVQKTVRAAVAEACELDPDALGVATDGCSAPNFSLPLRALAVGFKNLALARSHDPAFANALRRVRDAMQAHSVLVAGERRFDRHVFLSFPGNVVCKSGAEAVLAIGFRDPSLGIAIKVTDGGHRAIGPIAVELLKQLGIVREVVRFPELVAHERPVLKNARGLAVGDIVAGFRLHRSVRGID